MAMTDDDELRLQGMPSYIAGIWCGRQGKDLCFSVRCYTCFLWDLYLCFRTFKHASRVTKPIAKQSVMDWDTKAKEWQTSGVQIVFWEIWFIR